MDLMAPLFVSFFETASSFERDRQEDYRLRGDSLREAFSKPRSIQSNLG
jgi:hypothetical protein